MRPDGANWHNQLARDGTPMTPVTPARVLYHLFLAVAEADRLLARSRQASVPAIEGVAACAPWHALRHAERYIPASAFW